MVESIFLLGTEEDIYKASGMIKKGIEVKCVTWDNPSEVQKILKRKMVTDEWWVLCFKNEKTALLAKEVLVKEIGIKQERIFDLNLFIKVITPIMTVDRVMKNPLHKEYNGMILGISHAEYGIIPQLLSGDFCNLAVSSQDIYYNYVTLNYCYTYYYEKIKNLDTLVIDLFDYTYFNFDVSSSSAAISYYLEFGGITFDEHNFDSNKIYPESLQVYKDAMWVSEYKDITDETIDFYEKNIEDIFEKTDYRELANKPDLYQRNNMVREQDSINLDFHKSIAVKTFDGTIKENIEIFDKLLKLAYLINPNMRVCLVLLPKHYVAQKRFNEDPYFAQWKKIFYEIINDFQKNYPVEFLDLENHKIGEKGYLYNDATHLNYVGAIEFSIELNKLLHLDQSNPI